LNYSYKAFLNRDEFTETMQKAEMVITHGGTGAIIGAVKKGKRVIAVPRLAKYGEHVDDHQLQLIRQFDEMNIIYPCYELENLEDAVKETRVRMFNKYVSNTETIINSIEVLIEKI
ncbi:TPA: beta(1,3)galactosyltransferase EpsH, partial [Enterococcus faecium]|nr:beta(1,3)galactosyltransferase EpsH [Enterococcus faecium]HAR1121566.1 beta(1,3)galactosyltransferase EpsH [Enterococcus faecium]HAZ9596277.1 beta(1,3)galactosyltransferase EpsH [Enterococcus faecium]HCD2146617.1 beta(1,3)galactosyltransferase EpsH [Enterococcus faecium]HCR9837070.1 beta(1,3)galactosyltransferase EpsH [Enterococcus faecium]